MAYTSGVVFEVRSTGSANNGGLFNPAASGTDYSQQDTAQYSLTGLTSSGAGAVILTASAAADMVGNGLRVTGGTNFTAGLYEITSVSVGVSITVDRNCTTAAGAAGTCEIGGGLANLTDLPSTNLGAQWSIWVKYGTYTVTTATQLGTASGSGVGRVIGYNSTRGDLNDATFTNRPTITCATNSINLFNLTSAVSRVIVSNFIMSHTAATRGQVFNNSQTIGVLWVENCTFTGFSTLYGASSGSVNLWLFRCELDSFTGVGVSGGSSRIVDLFMFYCYVHDCGSHGVDKSSASQGAIYIQTCIFDTNAGHGVFVAPNGTNNMLPCVVRDSVFYNSTNDGFRNSAAASTQNLFDFYNNIFYGNGGYGINFVNTISSLAVLHGGYNAFGSNTSGARNTIGAFTGAVTLTADPFTNSAAGDFTLNSTAGGGAACQDAGYPASSLP